MFGWDRHREESKEDSSDFGVDKKPSGGTILKSRKTKEGTGPGEKDQEGKLLRWHACKIARHPYLIGNWDEESYQARYIILVMNETAQNVCTGWKEGVEPNPEKC